MRFECISKFWYSLIRSPNFISVHSTHSHRNTKIVSFQRGYCSSATSTPTTTLSFRFGDQLEEEDLMLSGRLKITDFEMVGCLNGVVCLSLPNPQQMYVLWNPATKQVRQIWGPPRNGAIEISCVWYGSVLSFDPASDVFKVAQFKFTPLDQEEIWAQVNVFSTATNSWTNKNIAVPYRILRISFYPGDTTCVNGFIYWLVGNTTFKNYCILSYNLMSDEVFQRIQMPSCPASFVLHSLTAYKGSLAMFVIDQGRIGSTEANVWTLNGCGNQSWSKILTCKLSCNVTRVAGVLKKDGHNLILFYNDWVKSFCLYDPENGETKILLAREFVMVTVLYSESRVSLHNPPMAEYC